MVAGRPRSAACDRAILDAALAEYAAGGLEGMSVDAVAARAGVSKATIYRRYPSKVDLVVAAAVAIAGEHEPHPDTGTLRGDLTVALQRLRTLLSHPVVGACIRMLTVDAQHNAQLAARHREFVHERRAALRAQLGRAVERGELRTGIDAEVAMDLLVAPLFYRHMVLHTPIDDAYIDAVVDDFVARYGIAPAVGARTER
jgi:AcrR family transcriptional regulator